MGKSIRLSIVALHSVDGVHQQFKELVKLAEELGAPREEMEEMSLRSYCFFLVVRKTPGGHLATSSFK